MLRALLNLIPLGQLVLIPTSVVSAQFAPPEPQLVQRDYVFEGLDQIPGRTFVLTYERRNLFFTKVVTNGTRVEPFDRVIWPEGRGAPGVMLYAINLGDDGSLPDEITQSWLRQSDCLSLAINEKLDGVIHADPAQPAVVTEHVTYRIMVVTTGEGDDSRQALAIHLTKIVGEDANGNEIFTRTLNVPGVSTDEKDDQHSGDDEDGDEDSGGDDDE